MFAVAIVGAFLREGNRLAGVHTPGLGLEVPVGAWSAVGIAGHHKAAPMKQSVRCTRRRGQDPDNRVCSCLRRYIRRNHLANILRATPRRARGHYYIVAEAAASAREVGGRTWRQREKRTIHSPTIEVAMVYTFHARRGGHYK